MAASRPGRRQRECVLRRARGLEASAAACCGGLAHVAEQRLLLVIQADLLLDIGERPGGDAAAGLLAQFLHARHSSSARARRRARTARHRHNPPAGRLAPEHAVEEVVIGVGPVAVVIAAGPERVVEDVGIGVGPEHRPVPGDERGAVVMPPGAGARPAVDGAGCRRAVSLRGESARRSGLGAPPARSCAAAPLRRSWRCPLLRALR